MNKEFLLEVIRNFRILTIKCNPTVKRFMKRNVVMLYTINLSRHELILVKIKWKYVIGEHI